MTPHWEWCATYDASKKGIVRLGNSYAYNIVRVGGNMHGNFYNCSFYTLKTMKHAPRSTKILVSIGQFDSFGHCINFGDHSLNTTKGSLILACVFKFGTLYVLHKSSVKNQVIRWSSSQVILCGTAN